MNKKIWLLILSLCLVVFCAATAMAEEHTHTYVPSNSEPNLKHTCACGNVTPADHVWGDDGICDVCGYTCMHTFNENNICTNCGKCNHKWVETADGQRHCANVGCQYENHICTPDVEDSYNTVIWQKGDCTTKEIYKKICKVCGDDLGFKVGTEKHDFKEGILEATCTNPAMKGIICTKCKKVENPSALEVLPNRPALGHNWVVNTNWRDPQNGKLIYKAATCTDAGKGFQYCSRCKIELPGQQENGYKIPAMGHNYDITKKVHVDANCVQAEHYANPCTRCAQLSEPVEYVYGGKPALGHKVAYTKKVPGNCVDFGYTVDVCSRCGDLKDTKKSDNTLVPENHKNYQVKAVLSAGSCTASRIERVKCDCMPTEQYVVTKAAHTWVKNSDYVAPTCGADGSGTQTCKVCGISEKVNEKATGKHTYVNDMVVPATCTEDGKIGTFCSVCFTAKTEGDFTWNNTDKATGHKLVFDMSKPYKAATCAKAGYGFVLKCEKCVLSENEKGNQTFPATGNHTWGPKQIKPATCEAPAMEGIFCTVCGNPKGNPTPVEGSVKLPHNYQKSVTPSNCMNYYTVTEIKCAVCGAVDSSISELDKDAADKHNFVTDKVIRAATCTTVGVERVKCNNKDSAGVACTEPATYRIIPVTHKWDNNTKVVVKPATCNAAGEGKYTCSLCGEVGKYTIPATGKHNYKADQIKAATCTDDAQVGTFCTVCWNNFGNDAVTIPGTKLGHKIEINKEYKDGNGNLIYVAATCDKTGIGYQACSRCGKEGKVVVIPALGHKYGEDILNEAGTALYHECGVCGNRELVKAFGDVDLDDKCALFGHTEAVIPAVAATCTEAGKTAGLKCTVCGKVLAAQEEVKALGHKYVDGVCSVCEAKDPEYVPHVHKYTKKYSFNADFTKRVVTSTCECGHKTVEEEDF